MIRNVLAVLLTLSLAACTHGAPSRPYTVRGPLEPLSNAYAAILLPVGDRCVEAGSSGGCVLYGPALIELVTRPERFHGTRVRVIGSITLEFERNVLCPREHSDSAECLWLDLDGLFNPDFRHGAALLEATFDGENRGHLGCCAGTLHTITRCERWRLP